MDHEDVNAWGQQALEAMVTGDDDRARVAAWSAHLTAFLQAARGILGVDDKPAKLPAVRSTGKFEPDYYPRRDERFAMR